MVITIDGPAGTGKSTAARMLAARLGFDFLDTGAMYRAVALAAVRRGVPWADETALAQLLEKIVVEVCGGQVLLDGEDVSELIRRPDISQAASQVAEVPIVRRHLVRLQRIAAAGRDIVTEGRDQGTVVFPEAEIKFFLTASPEVRAERRWRELVLRGVTKSFREVLDEQEERDRRDSKRHVAPLTPAPDAIIIDTTNRSIEEVLSLMEEHVRAWQPR
jgi:cytidylate kinase